VQVRLAEAQTGASNPAENSQRLRGLALVFTSVTAAMLLIWKAAPPIAPVLATPVIAWLIAYGMSDEQTREAAANLLVLLYLLINLAATICNLR